MTSPNPRRPSFADRIRQDYYDDAVLTDDDEPELPFHGTPAPLTIVPTSTTNPQRPRTLAAGYSLPNETLTVLFRDGVLYNYYDVGIALWQSFRASFSKGVWLREHLEVRGPGAGGERVTGGQGGAVADAIVTRAKALQQARRGQQRYRYETGAFMPESLKLSGFQNSVLKKVNNGQGMRATDAIAAAKADLARVRREAAARRKFMRGQ